MTKMPEKLEIGHVSPAVIGRVMLQLGDYNEKYDNPTGLRTVMGFALPEWQRGLVWADEQKVKLIESIWLGLNIGTYSVNVLDPTQHAGHPLSNLLIDGQQRMSAIEAYLNDEFEVFGAKWSEVERGDKIRFRGSKFSVYETHSTDENYLRSYYDLMNFGGTEHKPEERATIDGPGA